MDYRTDTLREGDSMFAPSLTELLTKHVRTIAEDGWEPVTVTYCNTGNQEAYHYIIVVSRKIQVVTAQMIADSITPWTDPRFSQNVISRINEVLKGAYP